MRCTFSISCHESGVIIIDALCKSELAGSLVAQIIDDNCRIDSLVVDPTYRGSHLSYEMLSELRYYLMVNTKAVTIEVSFSYLEQPIMENYNYIFAKMDYRFEPQELTIEFCIGDLIIREQNEMENTGSFSSLLPIQISQIVQELYLNGMVNDQYHLPANTDMNLSFAMYKKNRVDTFLWVTQVRDGIYRIGVLHNSDTPATLLRLALAAMSNAQKRLPVDSRVVLEIYNDVLYKIILKLTDNKAKSSALTSRFVFYLWGE